MVQQSYVVNETVFGINDALGFLRGKASRVRRPAQTMMLSDGLPGLTRGNLYTGSPGWVTWYTKLKLTPDNLPLTMADALASKGDATDRAGDAKSFDRVRHKDRINIMYFDGHGETLQITAGEMKKVLLVSQ
jgi:prepilin-type processing-associated H-X9-DG protein